MLNPIFQPHQKTAALEECMCFLKVGGGVPVLNSFSGCKVGSGGPLISVFILPSKQSRVQLLLERSNSSRFS